MQIENNIPSTSSDRIELARKCLALISSIAARGAHSQNPEHIGYALQEVTQVLFERTGNQKRLFEPVAADQIPDLNSLHSEVDLVDSFSQNMAMRDAVSFPTLPIRTEQLS